jgi:hypothetical protein
LRSAAIAGLTFTVLYLVHRILQGTGPDSSAPAAAADYHLAHRGALLASEVAVGLALLAFIPFLAALVPVIWRAGQETLAVAVAIGGGVFVAMGFVSNAAETALIGVADSNQPAAVVALDQLQGRTPVVWAITTLVAVLSLAIQRTGLVRRWLGTVGLIAAAIFLVFEVDGHDVEPGSVCESPAARHPTDRGRHGGVQGHRRGHRPAAGGAGIGAGSRSALGAAPDSGWLGRLDDDDDLGWGRVGCGQARCLARLTPKLDS